MKEKCNKLTHKFILLVIFIATCLNVWFIYINYQMKNSVIEFYDEAIYALDEAYAILEDSDEVSEDVYTALEEAYEIIDEADEYLIEMEAYFEELYDIEEESIVEDGGNI